MGITEPTGWGAACDRHGCRVEQEQEDRVDDWEDWADVLRQCGWIVVAGWTFCDLDCLLTQRAERWFRRLMADSVANHCETLHVPDLCCPEHGHHRADGIHSSGCPKRMAAR